MLKILWLAPNFNHYKARFLNHLAIEEDIELTIIAGKGSINLGHKELSKTWDFNIIRSDVTKSNFGNSKNIRLLLKSEFNNYDWVLIPAEKKNILLFLYSLWLRYKSLNTKVFSYNHPILKSKGGKITFIDRMMSKFYNRALNRVVFYTEKSCYWALKNQIISAKKAFWANNTIDNKEVEKHYSYKLPPKNQYVMVFIGRLIASKKIPELFQYYNNLKKNIPELKLEIIGDGPERDIVQLAVNKDSDVHWHGTLIDEARIAPIMNRASLIFVPGHSGLSINHAFAYGRPYITLQGLSHAPELGYIDNGKNGYVLDGNFEANINCMLEFLLNRELLENFCNNAKDKGEYLSVEKWVKQIKRSLINE